MGRTFLLGLVPLIAVAAACSPVERKFKIECHKDDDCPASTVPCQANTGGASGTGARVPLDGTPCDGGFCLLNATCTAGECTGTPMKCPDQDACNVGVCDEAAKACTTAVGNEGERCDDGDPCTADGVCQNGACTKGPDACAALANECIDATCGPNGCETQNKLDGTSCGQSFCSNGQCMNGHCDITPINEGAACDDELFCVINETCQQGFCIGVPNTCPTGNQCIKGTCDEASQTCVEEVIPEGAACDDGNACSAAEFCSGGVCTGGITPTMLFAEDFADNSKGWTLGMEWQIGPATASSGQGYGLPDPAVDVTGEGGVAGVAIGGNQFVDPVAPTHGFYYLTSPPISTNFAGTVYVTFYRWLNSDYLPYMRNVIEVSTDGTNWTEIWTTNEVPVLDSAWTFQAFDISAFKSGTTQIRWGFDIENSGVYTVSSWNIDKVRIQNAPCPD